MLVTKLSTKGQIVIPREVRDNFKEGTTFSVIRKNDLIIFKKMKDYSSDELKEIEELDLIWKEIESGKATKKTKKQFLRELDSW